MINMSYRVSCKGFDMCLMSSPFGKDGGKGWDMETRLT